MQVKQSGLTAERLRALLDYDPETGLFRRRVTSCHRAVAGTVAGRPSRKDRRCYISLDGVRYAAHRLAWLYVHGKWPSHVIDHINGDPADNRIANLRDVSLSTNLENQRSARSDSQSGRLGVGWCKHHGKWKARIRVNGRLKHLKYCDTAEEAVAVYLLAKRHLHAGCTI